MYQVLIGLMVGAGLAMFTLTVVMAMRGDVRWRGWLKVAIVATLVVVITLFMGFTESPPEHQPVADDQVVMVYITATGTKYHTAECRYVQSSKQAIAVDEAIRQGYEPCSVCMGD